MHYLTRQRLHLSLFHPLMKVLLSLYILSVGAGLWVASLKYTDRAEWTIRGMELYVHGSAEVERNDPFGGVGTTMDQLAEGKTRRELVDIAHPHLFTLPIVLFILGHLLHLTRLPDVLKLTVNVTAFGSFLTTFLLPFVVVDDATLTPVLYVSSMTLMLSLALLCIVPLWEMWFGKPSQGFDALPKR